MPITEVGGGSQRATAIANNVDSTTIVFPANVVVDNLLVCGGAAWKSVAATSITVTDTRSTAYTVFSVTIGASVRLWIAYGLAPSSGACTVTVNPEGTGTYIACAIDEFSGVHLTTPLDVDGGSSTGTSTTPSDSLTTLVANDLLLGVVSHSDISTVAITPGGAYTQIGEYEDSVVTVAYNFEYRLVTAAQVYAVDWTFASSQTWAAYTAAFQPAAAAAVAPIPASPLVGNLRW